MEQLESTILSAPGCLDRNSLVSSWSTALMSTSAILKPAADIRDCLDELADQIIKAFLARPFPREVAYAIGATLATLFGAQPTVLGTTIEVLARDLVAGLDIHEMMLLQPSLAMLLGELASGFLNQPLVGRAMDITERKHIAAISEREANFRRLIEHIPAITYIAALDQVSSTLYTSPQIESILGFTQTEWMADHTLWLRQVYPDDRPAVLEALRRSQIGEPAPCEYRMSTRDGQVVWFRDEAALIRDGDDRPLQLYGVMLDITERKRLESELSRAQCRLAQTQDAERLRIARDLHDGPVQQLLSISYLIDSNQRRLARGWHIEEQVIAHALELEAIRQEVVDVSEQLRHAISDLRPVGLEALGLVDTLIDYVGRLQRRRGSAGPIIDLDLAPIDAPIPQTLAVCLFRVAQETIRNTLLHAHARHIRISLRQQAADILLMIYDDGCGFHVPERLSVFGLTGQFGLLGLNERVASVGGKLTICSQAGQGTTVVAQVRLDQSEDRDD